MKPGSTQLIIASFAFLFMVLLFGLVALRGDEASTFYLGTAAVCVPILGLLVERGASIKKAKAQADAELGEWAND